jgi:hypothetical protein
MIFGISPTRKTRELNTLLPAAADASTARWLQVQALQLVEYGAHSGTEQPVVGLQKEIIGHARDIVADHPHVTDCVPDQSSSPGHFVGISVGTR